MNDYLLELFQKYKSKGVLIDANILLLYVVGSIDINSIANFKRTSEFSEDDFHRVSKFADGFDLKISTPHILTEVSDLLGNRKEMQAALKTYTELSEEKFLESKTVAAAESFLQFGLADAAISETAKNSYLVLTDENPLYGYLINRKIDAVNLSQIRTI